MTIALHVTRTEDADPEVPLPSYATSGAAGADVRANLAGADRADGLTLAPGARVLVPTGLILEIPDGYEVQVRARSGLALKQGIMLANGIGTIDSDYRGPLGVILLNAGDTPVTISHGDRVAQLVLTPVLRAAFEPVEKLSRTDRGAGGFGSTGRG